MQKVLNGIVAPHFILLWSFVLAEVPKDTALAEKTKGTHRVGRRRRPLRNRCCVHCKMYFVCLKIQNVIANA